MAGSHAEAGVTQVAGETCPRIGYSVRANR
jgi:hypothetical protein